MFAPTFLFRNQWLRYRLVRDYPEQLKFHQSSDHKLSDLVTATDALLSEIVHDTQITTDHQITSESESYSSTGSSPLRLTIGPVHTPQKRTELYHAALGIRTAISNQAVHISHPPDLHELSLENAQSIVPPHLFNFICLATGLSDEVPDSDAYLNVDNPSKVLSMSGHNRTFRKINSEICFFRAHCATSHNLQVSLGLAPWSWPYLQLCKCIES